MNRLIDNLNNAIKKLQQETQKPNRSKDIKHLLKNPKIIIEGFRKVYGKVM